MKTLTFDIESLPAAEAQRETLMTLYLKQVKKNLPSFKRDGVVKTFEDFFHETSFDGAFGRVLCIGFAVNEEPVKVICNGENEKKTLEDFWIICRGVDRFVGHNIMDFDFRFLYQRSVILGVDPGIDMKWFFVRYKHDPVYDTMKEWSKWGQGNFGLEHIALAMGIPTPKDGIDGSQVYAFYQEGKTKEICDYCMRDVDTTREIYKRMNFSD